MIMLIYSYTYEDIIQENYTYMLSQYYSNVYINKEVFITYYSLLIIMGII